MPDIVKLRTLFILIVLSVTTDYVSAGEGKKIRYKKLISMEAKEMQKSCQGSMPAAEFKVTPSGIAVPKNFKKYAGRIKNLKVKKSDIWLISYPKSGSTWAQEMIWLLANHGDIKAAKQQYLWMRFLFLEYKGLCAADNRETDPFDLIEKAPEGKRRFIKTHMPSELLPLEISKVKPKMIYLSRNPYDVAVSYFYHFQMWNNYNGTKELFFKTFLKDEVVLSPYWRHVIGYWKKRNIYKKNLLFIKYEDMKKDLAAVMKKVAKFLSFRYPLEKEKELLDFLSFESMKNNPRDNFEADMTILHPTDYHNYQFMRKGIVGSWKEETEFKPFIKEFEKWTKINIKQLKGEKFPQSPLAL